MGGPCRLQEQPRDAWEGGGSQGFVLFSHIPSLGNNAVKKRVFLGTGDAEAALSGWRRAPRKEGVWSKELLFDKENLKFLIKRLLFWEESSQEQEGALQRLKHPGDNHPNTKPSDGSTGAGKPLAVPNLHCNSRDAFGIKLDIELMILRSFPK